MVDDGCGGDDLPLEGGQKRDRHKSTILSDVRRCEVKL